MYLLRLFHLLLAVLLTVEVNGADVNCASFQSTSTSVTRNNTYTVTLKFAIKNECPEDQGPVHSVRIQKGLKGATVCSIAIQNESCETHVGCSCTTSYGQFIITKDVNTLDDTEWSLVGFLDRKDSFTETVSLQTTTNLRDQTTITTVVPIASDLSSTLSTQSVTPTTEPPPVTNHYVIYILIGVVVFVLIVVTILAIFVGVLFKKRARSRRLPLPPPAPHNFRRAVADVVMFHAQAAGLRDSDESFTSVQGHEYAEIPDDTDLSKSDNSLPSFDSYPVSDSSMSDCLHHIACPSSDSSLPEDYLHPVDATAEDISAESTGTLAPREPSVRGKIMKAAEHRRGDPPYVNTFDM